MKKPNWSKVPIGTPMAMRKLTSGLWMYGYFMSKDKSKITMAVGQWTTGKLWAAVGYWEDCRIIDPATEIRRLQDENSK